MEVHRSSGWARFVRIALAGTLAQASVAISAQPVPLIGFDASVDFLQLAADLHVGEVTGVAVNSKKRIFVFLRGNTTGPASWGRWPRPANSVLPGWDAT